MSLWAFILVAVLIIVDFLIYLPFCRAYDNVLFAKEKAEVQTKALGGGGTHLQENTQISEAAPTLEQQTSVLVLCAGAGTSAMLANALTEGAEEYNVPITASAGAYGSHYDIMGNFDMIILAPQVGSYYDDIKEDADRLNVKLIATKGVEYINLTRDAKKAIDFVLEHQK
jgi:PTS system lactose-specific IIC component